MSEHTTRYIVQNGAGQYLTPRRSKNRAYDARAGWADSFDDARIFMNTVAAVNAVPKGIAVKIKPVKVTHD